MDAKLTRSWTDTELEIVRKLANEGKSAATIAKALQNRSRNSVIGIMHRKGISFAYKSNPVLRREPPQRAERTINIRKLFASNQPKDEESPDNEQSSKAAPIRENYVPFLQRRYNQCKYIVEKRNDIYYCCGGPVDRKGWCAYHASIVYRPFDPKPIKSDGRGGVDTEIRKLTK